MSETSRQELLDNLLKLAEKEQKNGNNSINQEKLNNLTDFIIKQKKKERKQSFSKYNSYPPIPSESSSLTASEIIPKSPYSPLFHKFKLTKPEVQKQRRLVKPSKFKVFEKNLIDFLEIIANVLDNLHLFSKFPMFPAKLLGLLKQTNKLWVVLLLFLIRKTVSQLLNLIKKENKVKIELKILKANNGGNEKIFDNGLFKKYEKILKDLKFDKLMLYLELFGNVLDLLFNTIEVYGFPVPDWFMTALNFSSMFMTIYRMNKDDEYVDDDITEEMI